MRYYLSQDNWPEDKYEAHKLLLHARLHLKNREKFAHETLDARGTINEVQIALSDEIHAEFEANRKEAA